MTAKEFLAFVKKECKKHKVKFYQLNKPGIPDGEFFCNGYFSDDTGKETLAVATGKTEDEWVRILIHEYCHLQQWLEQAKSWTDCIIGSVTANDLFWLWISGEIELNERQKRDIFLRIMENEADCERRAVEMARKHNIDINEEEYAQKANAYILFYLHIMKTRQWYKIGKEPYNNENIYRHMPKKIIKNLRRVNPKLLTYF